MDHPNLLHQMNPLRHDFINSCLASDPRSEPPQQRRYLDIGCGGGIFAESAARLKDSASVLAIDPSSEVIKVARDSRYMQDPLLQQPGRLVYENKSLEDLAVPTSPSQQFDVLDAFRGDRAYIAPCSLSKDVLAVCQAWWLDYSQYDSKDMG